MVLYRNKGLTFKHSLCISVTLCMSFVPFNCYNLSTKCPPSEGLIPTAAAFRGGGGGGWRGDWTVMVLTSSTDHG